MLQRDWKASPQPLRFFWAILVTGHLCLKFTVMTIMGMIYRIPVLGTFVRNIMKKHPLFKGEENMTMIIDLKAYIKDFQYFKNELIHRTAITGRPAPDVEIINLQTKEVHWLRSLERVGRPLVVSFGSCT